VRAAWEESARQNAAPELLEACVMANRYFEDLLADPQTFTVEDVVWTHDAIKDAIAKHIDGRDWRKSRKGR